MRSARLMRRVLPQMEAMCRNSLFDVFDYLAHDSVSSTVNVGLRHRLSKTEAVITTRFRAMDTEDMIAAEVLHEVRQLLRGAGI